MQLSQQTDIHDLGGIRAHPTRKPAATDAHLKPRVHRDLLDIRCSVLYPETQVWETTLHYAFTLCNLCAGAN